MLQYCTKTRNNLEDSNNYLIVIGGPTAVGKTEVALQLAVKLNCPVLSADSRQFYREMSIGTAKPSEEELSLAPHYFINNLSVHDKYSVGDYERDVISTLDKIYKDHKCAILVGGTGLYINAVLNGLDQFPDADPQIRKDLNRQFRREGIHVLQEMLREKDPDYAEKVDMDNPHRLIRALSVILTSGQTFSSFQTKSKAERNFKPIKIALTMERHKLYERINTRVDTMMDKGLLEEVKSLHPHKELNALNTVGYSEIFEHLDGKCFISESIEKIKQNTRRYAKRQSTWFRNQGEWQYFDSDRSEQINEYVMNELQ